MMWLQVLRLVGLVSPGDLDNELYDYLVNKEQEQGLSLDLLEQAVIYAKDYARYYELNLAEAVAKNNILKQNVDEEGMWLLETTYKALEDFAFNLKRKNLIFEQIVEQYKYQANPANL